VIRPGGRLQHALAALVGGGLIGCSLPPIGSWPLGILGAALVVSSLRQPFRWRLAAGGLAGLGQFSIGLFWAVQFNLGGYLALVIVESAIFALCSLLVSYQGAFFVPSAAGALTLAEWVRDSWPFGGLPLGSAALGQTGGPLQFTARLGGPLLVVFTTVLAGGGLYLVGSFLCCRRARLIAAGVVCVVAAALFSAAGVLDAPGVPASAHRLRVALVQGGGERGLTALQVPAGRVFRAAVRETGAIAGHPQLILWPEDVVGLGQEPFVGSPAEAVLSGIARDHRATLVAGVTYDVGRHRFRNEMVAFSPAGRLVATFEKVHRVPFGEYVPLRGLFEHLANLSAVPRDAIAGHGSGMIATPAGRLAVLISYEVFFAERGRSGVRAGGELVIVPTNTSSYSNDQAPAEEVAASRLQAIEEGRYLVQVAPTGYSEVVSPSGVVSHETALSVPAVVEATVPLLSSATFYERLGDLPVISGSGLLVLIGLGLSWRRRAG
jgi:apolipoprotein N-acyltransferase